MATHDHEPVVDQEALDHAIKIGYDHRDVDTVEVGKFGLWFTAFAFLCIGLAAISWVVLDRVMYKSSITDRETVPGRRKLPPPPLLQSNITTVKDIADLRKDEDRKANHYGWVSQEAGIVRIPTDQAIDRLARRGLPAVAPQAPGPKPSVPENPPQ